MIISDMQNDETNSIEVLLNTWEKNNHEEEKKEKYKQLAIKLNADAPLAPANLEKLHNIINEDVTSSEYYLPVLNVLRLMKQRPNAMVQWLLQILENSSDTTVCSMALRILACDAAMITDQDCQRLLPILTAYQGTHFGSKVIQNKSIALLLHLIKSCPKGISNCDMEWTCIAYNNIFKTDASERKSALVLWKNVIAYCTTCERLQDARTIFCCHLREGKLDLFSKEAKLENEKEEIAVIDSWKETVLFLGPALHTSLDVVNRLLIVEEKAFRSQHVSVKVRGYHAWMALIDNYGLARDVLDHPKKLRLVMKPLQCNNAKLPAVAICKVKVWWHLIVRLDDRAYTLWDKVIAPFLEFMYSPADQAANKFLNSFIMKNNARLTVRCGEAVALILGSGSTINGTQQMSLVKLKCSLFPTPIIFQRYAKILVQVACTSIELLLKHREATYSHLIRYTWSALFRQVKLALQSNSNESSHIVQNCLTQLRRICKEEEVNEVSAPDIFFLIDRFVRTLPVTMLTSTSLSVEDASSLDAMPVDTIAKLLLTPKLMSYLILTEKDKFISLLDQLVATGSSTSRNALSFFQRVARLLGVAIDGWDGRLPVHFYSLWLSVCDGLTKWVMKTQEVNQGDGLYHDFTCLELVLLLPITKFTNIEYDETLSNSTVKQWNELYKLFSSNAAVVTTAEANSHCQSIADGVLKALERNDQMSPELINVLIHALHTILKNIDYKGEGKAKATTPIKKKKKTALGNIQGVVQLLARVLSLVNLLKSDSPQLYECIEHLCKSLSSSEHIKAAVQEFAKPLSLLIKERNGKDVSDMWTAVVNLMATKKALTADQDLLDVCSPMLEASLSHQRKDIQKNAKFLWQSVFGATSSQLNINTELKQLLRKVRPPLIAREADEDSSTMNFSEDSESQMFPPINVVQQPSSFFLRNATQTTPPPSVSPGRSIMPPPSRRSLRLEDHNEKEFVKIESHKPAVRVLTEHQKEKLASKHSHIPALYSDLSQDSQLLSNLSAVEEKSSSNLETRLHVNGEKEKEHEDGARGTLKMDTSVNERLEKGKLEKENTVPEKGSVLSAKKKADIKVGDKESTAGAATEVVETSNVVENKEVDLPEKPCVDKKKVIHTQENAKSKPTPSEETRDEDKGMKPPQGGGLKVPETPSQSEVTKDGYDPPNAEETFDNIEGESNDNGEGESKKASKRKSTELTKLLDVRMNNMDWLQENATADSGRRLRIKKKPVDSEEKDKKKSEKVNDDDSLWVKRLKVDNKLGDSLNEHLEGTVTVFCDGENFLKDHSQSFLNTAPLIEAEKIEDTIVGGDYCTGSCKRDTVPLEELSPIVEDCECAETDSKLQDNESQNESGIKTPKEVIDEVQKETLKVVQKDNEADVEKQVKIQKEVEDGKIKKDNVTVTLKDCSKLVNKAKTDLEIDVSSREVSEDLETELNQEKDEKAQGSKSMLDSDMNGPSKEETTVSEDITKKERAINRLERERSKLQIDMVGVEDIQKLSEESKVHGRILRRLSKSKDEAEKNDPPKVPRGQALSRDAFSLSKPEEKSALQRNRKSSIEETMEPAEEEVPSSQDTVLTLVPSQPRRLSVTLCKREVQDHSKQSSISDWVVKSPKKLSPLKVIATRRNDGESQEDVVPSSQTDVKEAFFNISDGDRDGVSTDADIPNPAMQLIASQDLFENSEPVLESTKKDAANKKRENEDTAIKKRENQSSLQAPSRAAQLLRLGLREVDATEKQSRDSGPDYSMRRKRTWNEVDDQQEERRTAKKPREETPTSSPSEKPGTPKSSKHPWERHVYSPLASPSASILKKMRLERLVEESPMAPAKGRRVHFAEPPVSDQVEIPSKTRKMPEHGGLPIRRRGPRRRLPHPVAAEPESEEMFVESPAMEVTDKPVCEDFVNITDLVAPLLERLTSPLLVDSLSKLLEEKGVSTIGELASMTENQVHQLPVRSPKVETVKNAIEVYYKEVIAARDMEDITEELTLPLSGQCTVTSEENNESNTCDRSAPTESRSSDTANKREEVYSYINQHYSRLIPKIFVADPQEVMEAFDAMSQSVQTAKEMMRSSFSEIG